MAVNLQVLHLARLLESRAQHLSHELKALKMANDGLYTLLNVTYSQVALTDDIIEKRLRVELDSNSWELCIKELSLMKEDSILSFREHLEAGQKEGLADVSYG